MVVIAVAGGTGGLGRAIVDELSLSGKHTVKIFTRNRVTNAETKANVSYVGVNYSDVDALVQKLEENAIHTIISTLSTLTKEVGESQMNLVKAADRSQTTKRFMPSEFGIICRNEVAQDSVLYWTKAQATAELRRSNLEFCLFSNGLFLDYFCGPSVKSYMSAMPFIVDIPHRTATIPGDGQDIIIFTHTTDVAKYVVACLELPTWPEHAVAIGERMTWNQFVQTCELLTGEKFNVSYITVDELQQRATTAASPQQSKSGAGEGESYSADVAQSFVWMAHGFFDAPDELAINRKFPDIKPLTLKDVL